MVIRHPFGDFVVDLLILVDIDLENGFPRLNPGPSADRPLVQVNLADRGLDPALTLGYREIRPSHEAVGSKEQSLIIFPADNRQLVHIESNAVFICTELLENEVNRGLMRDRDFGIKV